MAAVSFGFTVIRFSLCLLSAILCTFCGLALAAEKAPSSSYSPVVIEETPEAVMNRMRWEKPTIMKRQMDLLNRRYDLANRPDKGAAMTRGKSIQEGVRVKLPKGITWDSLAAMEPAQVGLRSPTIFQPSASMALSRAWNFRLPSARLRMGSRARYRAMRNPGADGQHRSRKQEQGCKDVDTDEEDHTGSSHSLNPGNYGLK